MILGLLTLITALSISAVAIYYSVAGLVAIFAAAALPIMIMGGVLEIAKLVTAVWLHKYWKQATWWLKTYLSTSVVVLMFITSMGIFGFLSKAHIEQTAGAEENIAQIARIEQDLIRQSDIITRAEERIIDAESSVGESNDSIQSQIDREQERIDSAYTRIEPAINEQNAIIQTQLNALENRVSVYEEEIQSLDAELSRLNALVAQYRTEISNTNVASIEEQVQPYRDQITQLDTDLQRINDQANDYEQRISSLDIDTSAIEALQRQIADIEENIVVITNKLQSNERAKIREGQAVIGVTDDGLFGGNTRRALTAWVEAQQERISQLQSQEATLRAQAQTTLDNERARLTNIVNDLRGTQTDNINQRKQSLLDTIDSIRSGAVDDAKIAKAELQQRIDIILNTDIPTNRAARQTAQEAITTLRQADDIRINAARQAIAELRAGADTQIAQSNALIQQLRESLTVGKDENVETIIAEQQAKIVEANNTIDALTSQKYALQAEYRKLEAEVGPVKYLAEFVYGGQADQDLLEEAVRWVILIIIFVFDPLAVLLLIASQYTFEINRKRKDDQKELLRLREREEYERKRAQRIVDNPGYHTDDSAPLEKEKVDVTTHITTTDADSRDMVSENDTSDTDASDIAMESIKISSDEELSNEQGITDDDTIRFNDDRDDRESETRGNDAVDSNSDSSDIHRTSDDSGTSEGLYGDAGTDDERGSNTDELVDPREEARWLELEEKEQDENYKNLKHIWKQENPKESIKFYKTLYTKGKIDILPWEPDLTDKQDDVGYIQNSEQNDNTMFNRLRSEKD